jgi:uncharacterized membrane protein
MGRTLITIVCLLLPAGSRAADLAADVRAVFSAKCTACHGPNVAKPRGRFGYVLDLGRVAGNREMVVPAEPDQSELWELVRRGEMPPEDSPTGPLTAGQKEAVRAWIAAGAPPGDAVASLAADAPTQQPAMPTTVLHRLGRFHVILVHFPIALLIAAAAAEVRSAWQGRTAPAAVVHFCVVLGAGGAITTAALGWLHATSGVGAGMPATLALHRWLGTATAVSAMIAVVLSARDERRGVRSQSFRVALIIAAFLVGLTGHLGGSLVFGSNFLTAP